MATIGGRPRVLIFHPALAPYRVGLFNALGKQFELKVIFLRSNLLDQKFDQVRLRNKLTVDYAYLTGGFTFFGRTFRTGIANEIRNYDPDVVVSTEYSPITVATLLYNLLRKYPVQQLVWTDDTSQSVSRDGLIRRLLRRFILPRVQGLIFISNETRTFYADSYAFLGSSAVVPIIQQEEEFCSTLAESDVYASKWLEEYKLSGKRLILYVGRLAPEKRIDRIIKSFSDVISEYPQALLVLVGEGESLSYLKYLVFDLGIEDRVIFTGRHEGAALYGWYKLGSIFVLASQFERFGAVVNEALLAGLPVICSKSAGARILIRTGRNGKVVDASNQYVLKQAICEWLVRSAEVTVDTPQQTRENLMPITFQSAVDSFVELLNELHTPE